MRAVAGAFALLVACGGQAPPKAAPDPVERALDDVARAHGAPGPWAVLGYRMGEHAPRSSDSVQ
jgi:hypothetical protein